MQPLEINPTPDLARTLHTIYADQYVCADIKRRIWYKFKGHRWVIEHEQIVRVTFSQTLTDKYRGMIAEYQEKNDGEWQLYKSGILKVYAKLQLASFMQRIMAESAVIFHDSEFVKKCDENPNLLVCENGVYDSEKRVFRDGRPDDYCTKTTMLHYQEYYQSDPVVLELEEIIAGWFVNPNYLKFFTQIICNIIRRGSPHKISTIWQSDGGIKDTKRLEGISEGCGLCVDLIEQTLGEYVYFPPIHGDRGIPHTKHNVVFMWSDLDPTMIKHFSPPFTMILQDPSVLLGQINDQIWKRIRVLPFCSTAETINGYEKLSAPLSELPNVFLWWLIKSHIEYGDKELYIPPEIQEATNSLHQAYDVYTHFSNRWLISSDKCQPYQLFKEEYKESYPGRIPTRSEFKQAMEKRLLSFYGHWDTKKAYVKGMTILPPEIVDMILSYVEHEYTRQRRSVRWFMNNLFIH